MQLSPQGHYEAYFAQTLLLLLGTEFAKKLCVDKPLLFAFQ